MHRSPAKPAPPPPPAKPAPPTPPTGAEPTATARWFVNPLPTSEIVISTSRPEPGAALPSGLESGLESGLGSALGFGASASLPGWTPAREPSLPARRVE